jgi:hypothetical protein
MIVEGLNNDRKTGGRRVLSDPAISSFAVLAMNACH